MMAVDCNCAGCREVVASMPVPLVIELNVPTRGVNPPCTLCCNNKSTGLVPIAIAGEPEFIPTCLGCEDGLRNNEYGLRAAAVRFAKTVRQARELASAWPDDAANDGATGAEDGGRIAAE